MLADAGSLLTHRGLDKSDGSKTITTPPARALVFVDVAGELFVIGSQLYKKHRGQLGQIQRDLPPTQPENCTKRARALAPAGQAGPGYDDRLGVEWRSLASFGGP